jgi:hypothetical protein
MINSTEKWKEKVEEYAEKASESLLEWSKQVDEIAKKTGLDDIAGKVKEIVKQSGDLRDIILNEGGVIDALKNELSAVSNLTGGYANLRKEL